MSGTFQCLCTQYTGRWDIVCTWRHGTSREPFVRAALPHKQTATQPTRCNRGDATTSFTTATPLVYDSHGCAQRSRLFADAGLSVPPRSTSNCTHTACDHITCSRYVPDQPRSCLIFAGISAARKGAIAGTQPSAPNTYSGEILSIPVTNALMVSLFRSIVELAN
jgi:hypothetical protein